MNQYALSPAAGPTRNRSGSTTVSAGMPSERCGYPAASSRHSALLGTYAVSPFTSHDGARRHRDPLLANAFGNIAAQFKMRATAFTEGVIWRIDAFDQ